jgi:hypothetical protein
MREFKLKISHDDKKISFGERLLGDVGRDITAIKVALGSIVAPEDLPNQDENIAMIDPNGWFDCTSGEEISPTEAATFDKNTQLRLMKFQLDNQLLIISYLFHKYGVAQMINESIQLGSFGRTVTSAIEGIFKRSKPTQVEYDDLSENGKALLRDEIILDVINGVTNLFTGELGQIGEPTIAVLHGWVPQSQYGNESYYHNRPAPGEDSVIDIIPFYLLEQYLNGALTQRPGSAVSIDTIASPDILVGDGGATIVGNVDDMVLIPATRNNSQDLEVFLENAPESYRWNPNAGFEYGTIRYKFKGEFIEEGTKRTSALHTAALQAIEAIPTSEPNATALGVEETQSYVERAVQPDPLTDPDPFVLDSARLGFFDIAALPAGAPFTFDNLSDWIAIKESPETIARLEDAALRKVLQHFSLPDIWYVYKNSLQMNDQYFIPGEDPPVSPDHSALLPHNKDQANRLKYWVLTTREARRTSSQVMEAAVQYYDEIEDHNVNEPLIKFIEYRTPSLRPGDPYRVYFEINRRKLDLIREGYFITEQETETPVPTASAQAEETMNNLSEQLTAVCENLSKEDADRRFQEYRGLAAKNRRELVRRIREATLHAHQSASAMHTLDIELGNTLGPMFDDTFGTNLGPFGQLDLSDGRYAQAVGNAISSGISTLRSDSLNAEIASGTGAGTPVKPDEAQLTTLSIGWSNLEDRVKIIEKDLKEAKKHATEEAFVFTPEGFDPVQESKNLVKLVRRIKIEIEKVYNKKGRVWQGFQTDEKGKEDPDLQAFFGGGDTNLIITFDFTPDDTRGSDTFGMTLATITKISTVENIYNLYDRDALGEKEPKEFEKKIAVGYLSQVYKMTKGWIPGVPAAQVAKALAGCEDLTSRSAKNGTAYLIRYSFGLSASKKNKTEEETSWHEGWADRNLKAPVTEWMKKSAKNNKDITDPKHFGQDEVLTLLGETCTWPKIWKEFINKVSLPMLLCDYLKCVGLPGVSIKAPSLNIPPIPKITIFGYYAGFVKFIKDKWQEIIIRILCTIVRLLLDFLSFPLCDQQFKEAFGNAGNYSPIIKDALADALFGLPLNPDDKEKAKDFVDDAFRALRGDEICRLLSGEPLDGAAMALLERLSTSHGLDTSWTDRDDILEFFSVIAGFIPSGFCERLEGLDNIAGAATCRDSTDKLEQIRRRLEANDDVSEEEITEALRMASENLMDNETAMQALLDNGLASMAGEYIAIGNPDALISSLPDSVNKSIERTAKFAFERSKMSYITTLSSFVPGLSITNTKLARAGDASYQQDPVIKIEGALQNLQDYQVLSSLPNASDPMTMDRRFLSLYQVFEATRYKSHIVHKRFMDDSTTSDPRVGSHVSYSKFLKMNPEETRLKVVSYSKQILPMERIVKVENALGNLEDKDVSFNFGAEYDGNPVTRPHKGLDHHINMPGPGPFTRHCNSVGPNEETSEGFSRCPDNPEFVPGPNTEPNTGQVTLGKASVHPAYLARRASGLPRGPTAGTDFRPGKEDEGVPEDYWLKDNEPPRASDGYVPRKTWSTLHNSWADDNLPDWVIYRQLDSSQAKEMFMLQRVQELTEIIHANLENATATETNSEHMALIKDVYNSSIERALEASGGEEQIDMAGNLSIRMSTDLGPFKPSVSLREFPSNSRRDAYTITLKDKYLFPEAANEGVKFEYCDLIPEEYTVTSDGDLLNNLQTPSLAKREVFAQHVLNMMGKDLAKYGFPEFNTPSDLTFMLNAFSGPQTEDALTSTESVYKLAFEGILESVFFKLRNSRIFDEDYAAGLHDRLSGKYKLENGCKVNKFNLNHFGILSFDKMVTDDIPDLVTTEMARPENQPQNLDYEQPGPVEKAIQMATLKGFVRVCLVELLLKGSIPYSVWDIEAVVGDQFFTDYINEYVHSQLRKNLSIRDFWGPIAEKIAGVSGARAALKKIIQDELLLMPDLSKKVFNNVEGSYGYIDYLTQATENPIIPNVNIPSAWTDPPGQGIAGSLEWVSQHDLSARTSGPFLSIEHYVKVSGPIADFSRLVPNPQRAAQAVQDSFATLSINNATTHRHLKGEGLTVEAQRYPERDWAEWLGRFRPITIRETANVISPFHGENGIVGSINALSLNNRIAPFPPEKLVIMADTHKDMEIYHIDEISAILGLVNTQVAGYDQVASTFGLDTEEGISYLAPEVQHRAPTRFIRRKRKTFKLSDNSAFDPTGRFIRDLIRLDPDDHNQTINFAGDEILSNLASQTTSFGALTEEDERFYIIPLDFWTLITGTTYSAEDLLGIAEPESIEGPSGTMNGFRTPDTGDGLRAGASDMMRNKLYRGWTVKGINGTEHDPLDAAAWWNTAPTGAGDRKFDHVENLITNEVLFRNILGPVDRGTYNAVKESVNDPQWDTDIYGSEPVQEENWLETVIDFTGNASMVFFNPGQSADYAVDQWSSEDNEGTVRASREAWERLKEYLPNADISAIENGLARDYSTLVFDSESGNIGPGYPMGYKPTKLDSDIEGGTARDIFRNQERVTILDPLTEFGTRDQQRRPIIRDLEDSILAALGDNDYKIPLRLLITQIEIAGSIEQVFCRVVIPEVLSSMRLDQANWAQRRDALARALTKVFEDYTTMIESAYAFKYTPAEQGQRIDSPKQKYLEILNFFKHEASANVDVFPVLLRQQNLPHNEPRAVNRPSFCSVSKLYSLACQEETETPGGIFSNSPTILDDLFKDRGYLMKDTQEEITSLSEYHRGVVREYNSWSSQGDALDVETARSNIEQAVSNLNKAELDEGWSFQSEWLDYLPDLTIFDDFFTGSNVTFEAEGAAEEKLNTGVRQLMFYLRSMMKLFGGTAEILTSNSVNEPNPDRTCVMIHNLLRDLYPTASWETRFASVPEPFRRMVSAGCLTATGDWYSGNYADSAEIFNPQDGRDQRSGFQASSNPDDGPRKTHISRNDLTDEEYNQFAIFALKFLFASQTRVYSMQVINSVLRGPTLVIDDQTPQNAGVNYEDPTSPDRGWQYPIFYALRWLLATSDAEYSAQLDRINAGENTISEDLVASYRHAISIKAEQRTGLNYLYRHNLHRFLRSGNSFNNSSVISANSNIERCNKVALSISNILTWYSQKRSESFWGMTSHPLSIATGNDENVIAPHVDTGRYPGFGPGDGGPWTKHDDVPSLPLLSVDGIRPLGLGRSEPTPEERSNEIKLYASYELPGIMCGFSPFAGDGRYHLEEFIEAYKEYFLEINQGSAQELQTLETDSSLGSRASNAYWGPKINMFWVLNELCNTLSKVHFWKSALPSNINSPDTRTAAPGMPPIWKPDPALPAIHIPYRDFKFSTLADPNSGANLYKLGLFENPTVKYKTLSRILKTYMKETQSARNILDNAVYEASNTYDPDAVGIEAEYLGQGVLNTNFFINPDLTPIQKHLIRKNYNQRYSESGFPEMSPGRKVFMYDPSHSNNITDHFGTFTQKKPKHTPTPNIAIYEDWIGYQATGTTPGFSSFFYAGFGKGQLVNHFSAIVAQGGRAGLMLGRQWQCMLEDTGLSFFYENHRRIFQKALFDTAEDLVDTSDIRDCSRLMLNIPSSIVNATGTPSQDFPRNHPLSIWLSRLRHHFPAGVRLDHSAEFVALCSEERAYRLKKKEGQGGHIYSFPLAKFESGGQFDLLAEGGNLIALQNRWDSRKTSRTSSLFETQEARTVIDYIFPMKRYMAMATAYSTSILGGYSEVPNLMTSTKASMATIMYLCSVNSRTRLDHLEDVSQAELMKLAQENKSGLGDSAMSCFDFPFSEDMMKQFWEELKTLVRQMPSIILRGIADVLDPAYKEMKIHWQNCDIKHLRNSGWTSNAMGLPFFPNNANIQSGLIAPNDRGVFQGGPRPSNSGDGVYVPILPAAISDMTYASFLLSLSWIFGPAPGSLELRNSVLRLLSYVYKGPASLLDPAMAFKIPCHEIDKEFKEKWNHGKYGRYGHPITPFTLLALMTPEINNERIQKAENCAPEPPPEESCEDDAE